MRTRDLKTLTILVLGIIAFTMIIVLQPSDDSPTWFKDFIETKLIGFMAVVAAAVIHRHWNTEKTVSH